MLFEYALEPDLLKSYENCRYLLEKFGIPRGRLLARFPKNWPGTVQQLVLQEYIAGRLSAIQYAKIETMLSDIRTCIVRRRTDGYVADDPWLLNAERENASQPFRAVLAAENPRNREYVLIYGDLDERQQLWAAPNGIVVPRDPAAIASAVFPLLRISETIVFVDRNFGPENTRHRRVFRELIKSSTSGRLRDPVTIVYFTGTAATDQFFLDTCREELPQLIPSGISVRMAKLAEKSGGEKFHNRYILTERGGISSGTGLDTGRAGETDDLNLLDAKQYAHRWNDYMGVTPSFSLVCETTIGGTGKR